MTWPRPVPTIGDDSAASERAADPSGWAFDEATIAALHKVIGARRDIRRFRPVAIDGNLLTEILAAGHQAPSVGQSQPWRFIVVHDRHTRDRAAVFADRERLRQADQLDPDRRARLLDLQLEGIREAPVGIVVACDRRVPPAGVLGRATFTDADLWSCACAIENIWLAARAAGLGLGWVTLFQPDDLAALLQLPDGVETLGWLCLGWPDERPPEPGLERAGWSRKMPLEHVILADRWPDSSAPDMPPSHLMAPDQHAVVAPRDQADRLLTAPGSLGVLDTVINRVLALGGAVPTGGMLLLAAADHPVTAFGVSAFGDHVTADVLAATQRGESVGAAAAKAAGLAVLAVPAETQDLHGDLVNTDALSAADVDRLIKQGKVLGRRAAATGLVCLGEVGIGNTTVAAALTCALLGGDAPEHVGLGVGADSAMVARKRVVVDQAMQRANGKYGASLREPRVALAALGGPEFALLTGAVLGAAEAGAPVVLDGLATGVAALAALRLEPGAQAHLIAGQRSRERAHAVVLRELGLEPLLELRLRAGEGVGACLAAQLVLTGLTIRRTAANVAY
jgi:nicotinate-nucleotide--dimethylbenzimidazole phosphoribosyltransferase